MPDIKVMNGPGPVPSHPIPPIVDPREAESQPEPITELPANPPAGEPPETPPFLRRLTSVQHPSRDRDITHMRRNLHSLFLVAAVASLGAINSAAGAASVDVQIGFPVPGIVVDAHDPYYYSPNYCAGCWYGEWGGRTGYHRGGGRPWERRHTEADHHGRDHGRDVIHEGHR